LNSHAKLHLSSCFPNIHQLHSGPCGNQAYRRPLYPELRHITVLDNPSVSDLRPARLRLYAGEAAELSPSRNCSAPKPSSFAPPARLNNPHRPAQTCLKETSSRPSWPKPTRWTHSTFPRRFTSESLCLFGHCIMHQDNDSCGVIQAPELAGGRGDPAPPSVWPTTRSRSHPDESPARS